MLGKVSRNRRAAASAEISSTPRVQLAASMWRRSRAGASAPASASR